MIYNKKYRIITIFRKRGRPAHKPKPQWLRCLCIRANDLALVYRNLWVIA